MQSDIMNPVVVQCYPHPNLLTAGVQRLFAECAQHSMENSVDWYTTLVDAVYGSDPGIRIYVAHRQEQAVAALPVRVTTHRRGAKLESLSNYYTSLYAPVLNSSANAHDLVCILQTILVEFAPLHSLKFAPMDPHCTSYMLLRHALQECGLRVFDYFCFGNWYLPVSSDWPSYFQSRAGAVRSTLKRMGQRFAHAGGTLELVQGLADVERGLAAFQKVYAASWKTPEVFADFVPTLMRTCARTGWLRLGIAWLHGQPVAAQLWIVAFGKAHIYKLAYDEAFKPYAPGTLLTGMLMEHVISHDHVQEVDYLIGDDAYKQQWMSQRRERWGMVAYNPTTAAGVLGWIKEHIGRVLKPRQSLAIIRDIQPLQGNGL